MGADGPLHLAVALDGAGWHPAAWREPGARPADLLSAGYWVDLVQKAEAALVDFVTIEDALTLQSSRTSSHDERTDLVRGRLDAVMVAARVAPLTSHIGLVPSVTVTHTEPFHISKAIATLDYVSGGRAGVRVQVSGRPHEAAHFGRRRFAPSGDAAAGAGLSEDLFDEAGDFVEVVRRLWDSWEDDAEIRDVTTGRFVDRDRLHYVDFHGRWFSVKGPSITPRPPQGQPIVTALAHSTRPYRLAVEHADVVYVTPESGSEAVATEPPAAIVSEVRELQRRVGRDAAEVTVLADLVVFLWTTPEMAAARKAGMDRILGRDYRSDARVFVGTAVALTDLMAAWAAAGIGGFRLRPGGLPHDLDLIAAELVPELQRRSLFRTAYRPGTLRDRMGWPRAASRYTAAVAR